MHERSHITSICLFLSSCLWPLGDTVVDLETLVFHNPFLLLFFFFFFFFVVLFFCSDQEAKLILVPCLMLFSHIFKFVSLIFSSIWPFLQYGIWHAACSLIYMTKPLELPVCYKWVKTMKITTLLETPLASLLVGLMYVYWSGPENVSWCNLFQNGLSLILWRCFIPSDGS